ncbi:MAG: hypothetical protein AB8H03_02770 [Saprospiraceae bacterium]
MAYTKFEFFENFGKGEGSPSDYGAEPRTFAGDLALVTNSPDYSCVRQINAQIKDEEGSFRDITLWVGIKTGNETVSTENLDSSHVTEFAAVPCPRYIQELVYFDRPGILSKM